jgi:LAS superfamily LD-carboxypeptidase LdcB
MKNATNFILEMLKASAGARGAGGEQVKEIEDTDTSTLVKENTEIIKKSNAFSENAAIQLDNVYNVFATNRDAFKKTSIVSVDKNNILMPQKAESFIPSLDDYFDKNNFIPVKVINADAIRTGNNNSDGNSWLPDVFDLIDEIDWKKLGKGIGRNAKSLGRGALRLGSRLLGLAATPEAIVIGGAALTVQGTVMEFNRAMEFVSGGKPVFNSDEEKDSYKSGALKQTNRARYDEITILLEEGAAKTISDINDAMYYAGDAWFNGDTYPDQAKLLEEISDLTGKQYDYPKPANVTANSNGQSISPTQPPIPNSPTMPVPTTEDTEVSPMSSDSPTVAPALVTSSAYESGEPTTPIEYGELDTPNKGGPENNDIMKTFEYDKIHFVSELIKFIYNTLSDGSSQTAQTMSSGSGSETTASSTPAAYTPSGEVSSMPSESATPGGTSPGLSGTPTDSKEFLSAISANKGRPGDTSMLNNDFAERVAGLIQSAPAEIRQGLGVGSAYRSPERQAEIIAENMGKYGFGQDQIASWKSDVSNMGPEAAGAKWRPTFRSAGLTANIGMPGSSNHQKGLAIDLTYNGQFLKQGAVPSNIIAWVHSNAGKFGLHFPMAHEDWHIEPVNARSDQPTMMAGADDSTTTATGAQTTAPSSDSAPTTPTTSESSSTAPASPSSGGMAPATPTTPSSSSTPSGKAISTKSTETYANAKIPAVVGTENNSVGSGGIDINNTTNNENPFVTAGIDKPLGAMTGVEQRIFENSGMFA